MDNNNNQIHSNFYNINYYKEYIKKLYNFYYKIKDIILINNDILLDCNIIYLKNNKLILDTTEFIKLHNYNLKDCLNFKNKNIEQTKDNLLINNLFIEYTEDFNKLTNDNCIEDFYTNKESFNSINSKLNNYNYKKLYESNMLYNYFNIENNNHRIDNIIEFGCGKLYQLQDFEKINPFINYIGIDKKENLIEKINYVKNKNTTSKIDQNTSTAKKEIKKRNLKSIKIGRNVNLNVINKLVTKNNFTDLYLKQIKPTIKTNTNTCLFGLHSCGDLTSEVIKIFVDFNKNNYFKINKLYIVGCCLNLLSEELLIDIYNPNKNKLESLLNLGFDNNGEYLDRTIYVDSLNDIVCKLYSDSLRHKADSILNKSIESLKSNNCGFPLSNFIKKDFINNNYDCFLSRCSRLASMSSIVGENDLKNNNLSKHNLFYIKKYLITVFEAFINYTEAFKEIKNFKGILSFFGNSFDFNLNKYSSLNEMFINYLYFIYNKLVQNSNNSNKLLIVKKLYNNFDYKMFLERFNKIINEIQTYNNNNKNLIINNDKTIFLEELNTDILHKINTYINNDIYFYIVISSYIIKLKFARIIEYIVAVDRIIYLLENNFYNSKLIKIFDPNLSLRNILIKSEI